MSRHIGRISPLETRDYFVEIAIKSTALRSRPYCVTNKFTAQIVARFTNIEAARVRMELEQISLDESRKRR